MKMISQATGRRIPCCWTECERDGDTMHQAVVREPGRNVVYLFCSDRHLLLWANSTKDMGNLPSGSKALGIVNGWTAPKLGT